MVYRKASSDRRRVSSMEMMVVLPLSAVEQDQIHQQRL